MNFKRSPLITQVIGAVRSEIFAGTWKEWIPSVRELSKSLRVGRNTCQSALQALHREKLIQPVAGQGNRVNPASLRKARSASTHVHSVGAIIPEVLGRLPPRNSLLIEEIRVALFDLGVRLQLYSSPGYYHANPRHALQKLLEKNPHDCWMLMLSTHAQQKWFMQQRQPCLVSGSIYPDIQLPFVDVDFRAVCRHAAGKLIALGHRRIVFFNRRMRAAGDIESEIGFFECIRLSSHEHVKALVVYHDDNLESVSSQIKKLFAASEPPTGLIVANPNCYLSIVTALGRLGLRVPEDVSVISRDDAPHFAYIEPEPSRYFYDSAGNAKKVALVIQNLLDGVVANRAHAVRIVPHFQFGRSLLKL